MSPRLTYRPRDGIVFGVVAGKAIRLTTLRNQAGIGTQPRRQIAQPGRTVASHVTTWDHVYELRSGHAPATTARTLTVAENAALEIFDYPGEYAQRFDGVKPVGGQSNHRHHARVIWVKLALHQGFPIHGPPACGDSRCLVIAEGWDSLFTALKATRQVSIVVEL
jgi:hypothetical protein